MIFSVYLLKITIYIDFQIYTFAVELVLKVNPLQMQEKIISFSLVVPRYLNDFAIEHWNIYFIIEGAKAYKFNKRMFFFFFNLDLNKLTNKRTKKLKLRSLSILNVN
jgi:hypothetical protein